MALQIRRGPTADRLSYTPVVGELVWDTSTNSLYIGNGSTAGGLPAGTLVTEDVQDIASTMLTSGTHQNITFTYDDTLGRINSTFDLSTFNGTLTADGFIGSHYANDSTLLLNALTGAVNLNGTVKGHVIPSTNIAYDLGSSSFRFRDLYLSGSSIILGSATITSTGSAVNLPAGSTVNGIVLGTAIESGMNYNINLVGDDSTLIVNARTKAINAASLTISSPVNLPAGSTINGVAIGSGSGTGVEAGMNYNINIVGDDSTLMLNARTRSITAAGGFTGNLLGSVTGNVITNLISSADSSAIICDTPVTFQTRVQIEENLTVLGDINSYGDLTVYSTDSTGRLATLSIANDVNGVTMSNGLTFRRSRGTIVAPTAVVNDDTTGNIAFNGYSGTATLNSASIRAAIDGAVSSTVVPGKLEFKITDLTGLNYTLMSLSGQLGLVSVSGTMRVSTEEYSLSTPLMTVQQNHATVDARNVSFLRGRGTFLTPTAVVNGDDVVDITFNGHDGSTYIGGLSISAIVDGAVSTGVVPTSLVISTNVGSGNTTRITISSLGDLTSTRAIKSSGVQGIGYATGAGGTGSQTSAKTETVTINKPTGEITTANSALGANTNVTFTLSNTSIAAGDHVIVSHISGGTLGAYNICAIAAANSATITIRNITVGSLTEAPVIKFTVIKSVTA